MLKKFDANFFHLSAKEAQFMEPSHRIFMETAFEAIENAGIGGENIKGTKTAIFLSVWITRAAMVLLQLLIEQTLLHLRDCIHLLLQPGYPTC